MNIGINKNTQRGRRQEITRKMTKRIMWKDKSGRGRRKNRLGEVGKVGKRVWGNKSNRINEGIKGAEGSDCGERGRLSEKSNGKEKDLHQELWMGK